MERSLGEIKWWIQSERESEKKECVCAKEISRKYIHDFPPGLIFLNKPYDMWNVC